ncbi:iron ABC transporter permease [Phyllobacterium sp. YR531]|uniref:FecCD family ABC transporter permease n=1 Tax=Phyllobacterium sp. YR531 TaxID=1144343 RepID=UPI00026F6CE1|nr:iron ABC transporter permease [Phyllobacterium sp. YR531]EJN02559.1 ABC-type Fe3+-siderophore transport system, permease component [Phyllobacterium sp. YR531]
MIRFAWLCIPLFAGLFFAGLIWGEQSVDWSELVNVVSGDASAEIEMIVLELRLPRVVLAMLAGMALATAGAMTQSIMRNPLAEPGILGINAGAALAVTLVTVVFPGSLVLLSWAGFTGAAIMAAAVCLLAWRNGTSSLRIILIGIGLSSLAGAGTSFLTAFGNVNDVQRAMIWLSGSLYGADWSKVRTLALWLAVPMGLSVIASRQLDLIRLGDEAARSLGQRVNFTRGFLILLCTLISGATVAAVGLVGFIGLIAPHLARKLVGPHHNRLLPVSALIGGPLLMAADVVGRTLIAPAQLPAGVVTALIGAPFLAWLLWGRHNSAV